MRWQSWKVDDGLPDNNVSNIRQLPDGVMLIATYGGMVSFEGLQMTTLETEPGVGKSAWSARFCNPVIG